MNLRRVTYWIVGLCLIALGGCRRQEPIEEYTVPNKAVVDKLTGVQPVPRMRPPMMGGTMRGASTTTFMLVAMVPHQTKVWFFKLALDLDPLSSAAWQQPALKVVDFLETVQLSDSGDGPPTWTIPSGWQQQAGPGQRYRTIAMGTEPGSSEITVTSLPMPGGEFSAYMESNLQRWRGEMKGDPNRIREVTKAFQVGGEPAVLVTMLSADAGGEEPAKTAAPPTLTYDTPEGWKPGRMSAFRKAAFVVEDGKEKVETTVIPLRDSPLLDNINRWRGEVGLTDIEAKQVSEHAKPFAVDSIEGHYVQCVGATRTVFAVLFEHAGQLWFITLKGDNALAKREQKHFEEFARSIKFKQPDGERDGK